ncbi:hypothetical protein C8R43DRAFT_1131909 [Mycena crocata]|nr:hypothetical protein C8R43DRAFT_1131909 [Mycena crocata]
MEECVAVDVVVALLFPSGVSLLVAWLSTTSPRLGLWCTVKDMPRETSRGPRRSRWRGWTCNPVQARALIVPLGVGRGASNAQWTISATVNAARRHRVLAAQTLRALSRKAERLRRVHSCLRACLLFMFFGSSISLSLVLLLLPSSLPFSYALDLNSDPEITSPHSFLHAATYSPGGIIPLIIEAYHVLTYFDSLRAVCRVEENGMVDGDVGVVFVRLIVEEWRLRPRVSVLDTPVRTGAHAVLRGEVEHFDLDLDFEALERARTSTTTTTRTRGMVMRCKRDALEGNVQQGEVKKEQHIPAHVLGRGVDIPHGQHCPSSQHGDEHSASHSTRRRRPPRRAPAQAGAVWFGRVLGRGRRL